MSPAHLHFADEASALEYQRAIALPVDHGDRRIKVTTQQLRDCARSGLSLQQTATRFGLHWNTVYQRARSEGIEFQSERPRQAEQRFKAAVEEGKTAAEIAAAFGLTVQTVRWRCKRWGLTLTRASRRGLSHDSSRSDDMAGRYLAGETLEQIGASYGISRERVRQIIKKYHGLTGSDGGYAKKHCQARAERAQKRDEDCIRRFGLPWAEYKAALNLGREMGCKRERTPRGAYCRTLQAAKRDGYAVTLSFGEWWQLWQQSGRWEQRGRGHGKYVLIRRDKTKPLAVDNAVIVPFADRYGERAA